MKVDCATVATHLPPPTLKFCQKIRVEMPRMMPGVSTGETMMP